MKKSFRAASIVCALTLLASLATACQNGGTSTTSSNNNSSAAPESSSSAPESSSSPVSVEDAPTVQWYVVGGQEISDNLWNAVAETIDPITVAGAGVKVHINCIDWDSWDTRRNTMIQSNEYFDIMFTNGNTYNNESRDGVFADITDVLKNDAKELYDFNPQLLWDGVTVNGKIYGVPSYKDTSAAQYFAWDTALLEKIGMKEKAEKATTLEACEEIFKAIKESGEPDTTYPLKLTKGGFNGIFGTKYDGMGVGVVPIGIKIDTQSNPKVVNIFEQDDIKNTLTTLHKYYEAGYINPDAAVVEDQSNKYNAFMTAQGFEGADIDWARGAGLDEMLAVKVAGPYYTTESIQGSVNCISSGSKYVTESVKLLQVVNTNATVRNYISYGAPADDTWHFTDDEKNTVVRANPNAWPLANYTLGTYMNLWPSASEEDKKIWKDKGKDVSKQYSEYVKAQNESATSNCALGFAPDTTSIKDTITALNGVWDKYKAELWTGTSDPATILPQMNKELQDAGIQQVIDEVQKQLDEFVAG